METKHNEEFRINGGEVMKRVKELIAAGNARRIIIGNEAGESIISISLTIAVIIALIFPLLAVIGIIVALVTKCTIVVMKKGGEKA